MTETTRRTDESPEAGLCPVGSESDNPCWREATERAYFDSPTLECHEHAQEHRLTDEAQDRLANLEKLAGWLREIILPTLRGNSSHPDLERRLEETLDAMLEDYRDAAIQARAAEMIAE